jgi:NDP-sugar pyrophosphorylase family protein
VFSIIDSYVRMAGESERIIAFRADEYYWRDLGRPENVSQAERDVASGAVSIG